MAKNPLRTFLGLNRKKNKNIKAWLKKRSSYKKKCKPIISSFFIIFPQIATNDSIFLKFFSN